VGFKATNQRVRASALAARQRTIAVSEFFAKNRHLLGFDSPKRALLTAVKEAVDNSLDACEDAGLLPEVWVELGDLGNGLYRVAVEDNGPGIVDSQIAHIFGKLLYGSRFHALAQSRGQQGLGISAAGMYAQMTTGRPVRIVSRIDGRHPAREVTVSIDTLRNRPEIHSRGTTSWHRKHGTRVEMDLEGQYHHGLHSVALYLKLTAIANPHVTLHLCEPDGTLLSWERTVRKRPPQARRIKPHPHGVELGQLIAMLKATDARHLRAFLRDELSQVGARRADEIIAEAGHGLTARSSPRRIAKHKATFLHAAIAAAKVPAPPADCVVPIGEAGLLEGLRHEVPARFVTAVTRRPAVYRGNPFVVEVGLAYGTVGGAEVALSLDGHPNPLAEQGMPGASEPVRLLRFANRVPLLYQQSHCAMTQAVMDVHWRRYGLDHARGSMPRGPLTLMVHLASVWVPFTSESKEAIASYPEVVRELSLALNEVGRRLAGHVRKEQRVAREEARRTEIERYLPFAADAIGAILDWPTAATDELAGQLRELVGSGAERE